LKELRLGPAITAEEADQLVVDLNAVVVPIVAAKAKALSDAASAELAPEPEE
jgi:hypothetical protein